MRGIAGIIDLSGCSVPPQRIQTLVDAMAIGPVDRRAVWQEGAAGLTHLLRADTPEDRYENQPIVHAAGHYVLVTDALLSHREELIAELGGNAAEASTTPDSALVAAAYEKWGEACPAHLEGRFALAVWQPREQRLFAAVDPLAHRPFYYARGGSTWSFASTLRGLLGLPEISRELDLTVLAEGFAGMWQVDGRTAYRHISLLPRGSTLRLDATGIRITRYWHPEKILTPACRTDAEYQEAFRDVFMRAIRGALRSPAGTGVMVSGGLDSAAVTAFAGRWLHERGQRLQAFHLVPAESVPYAGELREYDESPHVRDLCRSSPHIDFHFFRQSAQDLMSAEEVAQVLADECVPAHGLPLRPLPAWEALVRERQVHLMLNGLGGNQVVSPQIRSSNYLGYLAARGRWLTLAREIHGVHHVYGTGWRSLWREAFYGSGWIRPPSRPLPMRLRLLHPSILAHTGLAERFAGASARFRRTTAADWHGALAHALSETMVQQAGISASVINRHAWYATQAPLLDRRLNEFCLSLPPAQQFRAGYDRRLLREIARPLLPEPVRLRTTRGFPQPFALLALNRHREQIVHRLDTALAEPGVAEFFDLAVARQLLQQIAQPNCSPPELHTASSLLNWAQFLGWHARRS